MKKIVLYFLPFCFLILTACGGQPAATASTPAVESSTATASSQDPCTPENLPATVQPINDLMREFDDASQMATNTPAAQLPTIISNMQRIRRDTQDVRIPPCLSTLKTHQLNHMELMIQTLIAFVGGANQETLKNGLDMARKEHDLYSLEIVRLLGVTLAPITVTPSSSTEIPAASSTP